MMKKKESKHRIVLHVKKNSNEKQSNQVVIETERKHLVEFSSLKNLLLLQICILILVTGFRDTYYLFRKA